MTSSSILATEPQTSEPKGEWHQNGTAKTTQKRPQTVVSGGNAGLDQAPAFFAPSELAIASKYARTPFCGAEASAEIQK